MPLVLSLRAGQDFYLGDDQVVVAAVQRHSRFELLLTKTGKRFAISQEKATEIVEDVFISAGDKPQAGLARIAIEAPREIIILRGDRYRDERELVQ